MSETSFKQLNLDENIVKAIELCGYTTPTPVQAKAIPPILAGKDVVASAQTGTGKTAAFVLPALDRLSKQKPSKKTRILILTPTRELAAQITKATTQYGKFLRFNFVNLVGGMPYNQQIRELSRGADIIVATPGRLLDHIESKRVDLSHVEMLVLDEADRMLDMGFIEDVEHIAKLTPEDDRQTLLFSATVGKELTSVVRHLLKNPVRIDLSNEKLTVPQIEQKLYKANNPHHKSKLLKHFLNDKNIFKAIIFTATKISADRIADQLSDDGFAAAALHGDLRQNVRTRTVEQLRRGKIQFLVATDVAARGIDISDVTHVINYDLPRFCEDYVHRIGRTGRAGKSGIAISFVLPTEMRNLQRIERYIGQRLQLISNLDVGQNEARGEPRERDHDRSFEKSDFKKRGARSDGKPFRKRFEDSEGDRERKPAFRNREDKPFKSRASEGYRDRKPAFRSREDKPSERSSEGYRDRKPAFRSREDKPSERSSEGYRDRKPAFRSREDKPFKKRYEGKDSERSSEGHRDRKPAFRDRDDKPFKKRYEGKDGGRTSEGARDRKPAFKSRDDKPFKRTEKSEKSWKSTSNQDSRISYRDKPAKKRSSGGGNRPFSKRSERRDRAE